MTPISRRTLLSALAVAPLAACTVDPVTPPQPSSPSSSSASPTPTAWPSRPGDPQSVTAAVFDGAFGVSYVVLAGDALKKTYPDVTTRLIRTQKVATELAGRFADGNTPPDLIDNSGPDPLPIAEMLDQFLPLDDVVDAPGPDGAAPISESLYTNALTPGILNGDLVAINYALTVYGLWHSAADFAAEGWSFPSTWDAVLDLGEHVRSRDQFLFVWGDDAVTYYQELAIASAIKEGGHDVRRALDNLDENGWAHPAVTLVLQQLEACVREGYVLHGGPYLEAQALWARDRRALLYPSGAWIARETQDVVAEDFALTAAPAPTLTSSPMLPQTAIHATSTESFLVPAHAANPDGGKALLREMLSTEVASEFSRTNLMPTVVRNSIPTDLVSSALTSQTRLLSDAGDNVFTWRFGEYYGLNVEQGALWARFLSGELTASLLAEQLQGLSDRVRNDPNVVRYSAE